MSRDSNQSDTSVCLIYRRLTRCPSPDRWCGSSAPALAPERPVVCVEGARPRRPAARHTHIYSFHFLFLTARKVTRASCECFQGFLLLNGNQQAFSWMYLEVRRYFHIRTCLMKRSVPRCTIKAWNAKHTTTRHHEHGHIIRSFRSNQTSSVYGGNCVRSGHLQILICNRWNLTAS